MRAHDLVGKRFGRLVVEAFWGHDRFEKRLWLCRCDCGKAATPSGNRLLRGDTRSCGCLHDELASQRFTKHGGKHSQVYNVWCTMKGRCLNPTDPRYKYYGGRGITVCDRWKTDFAAFRDDMGPRLRGMTLERKDNNGSYSPDNCIWATMKTQGRNTRRTKRYEHKGENLTLGEWSERTGIAVSALYFRINESDWTIEEALTTPSRKTTCRS